MKRKAAAARVIILRVLLLVIFIAVVINAIYTPSIFRDPALLRTSSETTTAYDAKPDVSHLIEQLRQGETDFDWAKWIDLHKIELYERHELDPKLYPYIANSPFEELTFPRTSQSNQHEVAMMGRIYCKHYLPAPMRVIVLPEHHQSSDKPYEEFFVTHEDIERRHRQYGHDEPTEAENMALTPPLVGNLTLDTPPADRLAVTLDPALFIWKPYEVAGAENYHKDTILRALDGVSHSTKHFYECALRSDPMGYGGHYDWRFFRGVENYEGHTGAVHALARAWQLFAETVGISYWYAHGALIGWYWNGFTLPWDPDLDIQMPVMELDRLAKTFNRTLVVQESADGVAHKFLIDVGPWYVDRNQGNYQNVIDARFIDVDTGVYMDITGLAYIRRSAPIAMCKNRHRVHVEDVSPMRRTTYEGAPAYVPRRYGRILSSEYERWEFARFGRWRFKKSLRVWELEMTCAEMLKKFPKAKNKVYCYPREMIDNCDTSDKTSSCNKYVLAEYEATKDVTSGHDEEMKLWAEQYDSESQERMIELVDKYHPPFHTGKVEPVDDDFEIPVVVLDDAATATFFDLKIDPSLTGFAIKPAESSNDPAIASTLASGTSEAVTSTMAETVPTPILTASRTEVTHTNM